MHGIEDRLKALAAEPLLVPPAASRQATLDAMAAAARAGNAPDEGTAETEAACKTEVCGLDEAELDRAQAWSFGRTWARAAIWLAVVGMAVAAGAIALRYPSSDSASSALALRTSGPATEDAGMAAESTGSVIADVPIEPRVADGPAATEGGVADGDGASGSSETVFELAVAAAQLDLMLAELPRSRQVVRLGTAGTIIGLEDQIRFINSEIRRADAEAAPLEYRAALMQDRVDVLSALYYVRYAQSRVF